MLKIVQVNLDREVMIWNSEIEVHNVYLHLTSCLAEFGFFYIKNHYFHKICLIGFTKKLSNSYQVFMNQLLSNMSTKF